MRFLYWQKGLRLQELRLTSALKMMTSMNTQNNEQTADCLLKDLELSATDAARLILECTEELGERTQGLRPFELLQLLRRTLREGVQAIAATEQTVSFQEAAIRSIEARSDRRPTTRRDLRHFVRRMLRVDGAANLPLRKMTTKDCRFILEQAFGDSPSSLRKGRAILHSIFTYGMNQEWVDSNPVKRIACPSVREKSIRPLSLSQTRKLQAATTRQSHRDMKLSLHLMLYCGLRPTEVQRLSPQDIDWEQRQVFIRPDTAKTGGGRFVPLRCFHLLKREDCNIPRNWYLRWRNLRRAAGFRRNWAPDSCRHTFASYHAAHFRNLGILQLEMGHRDTSLLRSRYISAVSADDARKFWETAHRRPLRNIKEKSKSIP